MWARKREREKCGFEESITLATPRLASNFGVVILVDPFQVYLAMIAKLTCS